MQDPRKRAKTCWIHGKDYLVALKAVKSDNSRRILMVRFPVARGLMSSAKIRCTDSTDKKALEGYIREQPTQYFWGHQRFKTRPEGVPELY
jgi:hypothetical protein